MKKPTTVALVHPFEYQQNTESLLVCELFKQELPLIPGVEVVSVTPSGFLAEITQSVPVIHRTISAFERLTLSPMLLRMKLAKAEQAARRQKRDFVVLISDQSLGMLMHGLTGYKVMAFIYSLADLYAAHGRFGPSKGHGKKFEAQANLAGLISAECFITPTQAVMKELDAIIIGAQKKTTVAPLPVRYSTTPRAELGAQLLNLWRSHGMLPPQYILHCGSANWNNNRIALIHICSQLKRTRATAPSLVFAGEKPSQEENALIESTGISFYYFDEPNQHDIEVLLHGAACLAEIPCEGGLGYNVLQALALETPVVITSTDALMEIFSESAAIIIPAPQQDNMEEWSKESASAIVKLLDISDDDKASMAQEALSYVNGYTAQRFQGTIAKALES